MGVPSRWRIAIAGSSGRVVVPSCAFAIEIEIEASVSKSWRARRLGGASRSVGTNRLRWRESSAERSIRG